MDSIPSSSIPFGHFKREDGQCPWPARDNSRVKALNNNNHVKNIQARNGMLAQLGMFSQWAHFQSGKQGVWHLLTDCFPDRGQAWKNTVCMDYSREYKVKGDGSQCGSSCAYSFLDGRKAKRVNLNKACSSSRYVCSANTGVSSYGYSKPTWLTFIHEISHNLGFAHQAYGVMHDRAPSKYYYKPDQQGACNRINSFISGSRKAQNCFAGVNAVCGNGRREKGEACDDGNGNNGDGCSATCKLEAGYVCSENFKMLSTCTVGCGNGVVDVALGEDCDDNSACCKDCKFTSTAECSPVSQPECCTQSCVLKATSESCGTRGGYCGPRGKCVEEASCTKLSATVLDTNGKNPANPFSPRKSCPILASNPCKVRCVNDKFGCIFFTGTPSEENVPEGSPCVEPSSADHGTCVDGTCVVRPPASKCGNGKLDPGEECDDATKCCSGCKLVAGAECSYEGNPCCTETCSFRTASTSCSGGDGYCSNGQCVENLPYCDDFVGLKLNTALCPIRPGALDGCRQRCVRAGGCSFSDTQVLPDGTACDSVRGGGERGTCADGICVRMNPFSVPHVLS